MITFGNVIYETSKVMSISILFRVNVELLCLVSCIGRFVYGKATIIQRQSLVDMPELDLILVMYKYVKIFYSFKFNIEFFLCPWHWPYKKVLFEQPLDYESKSDHVDKYPCWCDTKTLITKHVRQTTFLVQQNKVIVQMSLWTNIHVDVMKFIRLFIIIMHLTLQDVTTSHRLMHEHQMECWIRFSYCDDMVCGGEKCIKH